MKRKSLITLYEDKIKLCNFYQEGNSLNTSAKEFKTSVNIIRQILKEFNIKTRTFTEAKKLKRDK